MKTLLHVGNLNWLWWTLN